MTFYWLFPFLAAVLDLFLCFLALGRAPHKKLNQIFALFALSLTSWNLDIAALYFFSDYDVALLWSTVFRYGMLFIPITAYHLALTLTGHTTLWTRAFLICGYGIALFLCFLNVSGPLVTHLKTFEWGYYPVPSAWYSLFSISASYLGLTIYELLRGLRISESARQRQQLKIVCLGLAVQLPLILTNLLPVYGISFFPLGNFGNVFLCGAFTYAIVKHRLLDIELIITKTVASVTALIVWLVPLWLLTAWMQREIYGASDSRLLIFALSVFILSGIVFPWLLRKTESGVRNLLWGQKYDSLQALSAFQQTIMQEFEQKKIAEDLCTVLGDALQTESVRVFLQHTASGSYKDTRDEAPVFRRDDSFLLTLAQHQEPIVREELLLKERNTGATQLATTLAAYQTEICVPLHTQDQLTGFLFLGKKRNRDIFSAQDLHLLSTLGTQVAVALENARLYEELRTSQVMLARNDRLAAVGTLAAGLAHEIRNPLVAVHTFVQLLPEQIDDPEFRTTFMELTTSELDRISTLINDLLAFSRPSPSLVHEVHLNDLAEQAARLLAGQAKQKSITLTTQLASDLPPLMADPGQIKQVLMNLLMNALQATDDGGSVLVATTLRQPESGPAQCQLTIQDTGAGIPADQLEQIFDPFFTTKEAGTGLGLAITHQIIQEHNGSIDVESSIEQGTRFTVCFPVGAAVSRAAA